MFNVVNVSNVFVDAFDELADKITQFISNKGNGKGKFISAFIAVLHTQGAQVRITQFYQQIRPYLPLPRKHSPDGASPD